MKSEWSVAEAKAKFSEVIARASSDGPQFIGKHGRPAAVVVSAEEWARLRPQRSALEVLTDPSVRGLLSDEEVEAMCRREGGNRQVPEF